MPATAEQPTESSVVNRRKTTNTAIFVIDSGIFVLTPQGVVLYQNNYYICKREGMRPCALTHINS